MNLFKKNQMTLKEIERFMDAKRKREAKARAEIGLQNKVKELQNKGWLCKLIVIRYNKWVREIQPIIWTQTKAR